MGQQDNGGPAFPHIREWVTDKIFKEVTTGGMSLRDYFAGQALIGFLSSERFHKAMDSQTRDGVKGARIAATACYEFADFMLRARSLTKDGAPSQANQ